MSLIRYHLIAFILGMALDALIGDPPKLPHPVRWIGGLITFLEGKLRKTEDRREPGAERRAGVLLVFLVVLITAGLTAAVTAAAYLIAPPAGVIVEGVLIAYTMAVKDLKIESMRVHDRLTEHDVPEARSLLSRIVGRDTEALDEEEIARATVETIAENFCDGVIAPMVYDALGGPILGMAYKAVNTMDSMVGYRNEEYQYFGWFAARMDDVANFIPARLAAFLMIFSCTFMGPDFNTGQAKAIYKRDRRKTDSPNAGHTESVVAGALGIALGGDASYFGRKKTKPLIGDAQRPISTDDIIRANKLMETAAVVGMLLCITLLVNL